MTLSFNVGDFLIVQMDAAHRTLVKTTQMSRTGSKVRGVLASDLEKGNPTVFDFNASEVVAVLGKAPAPGSVYGVKVEPLHQRIDSKYWGEVRIYLPLADDHRKIVTRTLKEMQERITKARLPPPAVDTEIRQATGKMRGYYKHRPSEEFDILCIKLDEVLSDLDYVIAHEYAHGIWFRHMTPRQKMAWVRMYHSALTLSSVTNKELKSILAAIIDSGDVSSFSKSCDEEDLVVLRAVFRHMKQVHSIDKKHFDMAVMLSEPVEEYWPTAVELSEKQVLLTDYAKKSPEELFAEAFSLSFVGNKLPGKVADLLDKTLRSLK